MDIKLSEIKKVQCTQIRDMNPYVSYSYSYPHKSAYRFLERPIKLRDLWQNEATNHLFLYIHIPFCGNRCAYCNLFSQPTVHKEIIDRYIDAVIRQGSIVKEEIGRKRDFHFDKVAIGGGTPTLLDVDQLTRLFKFVKGFEIGKRHVVGLDTEEYNQNSRNDRSISVETHPLTSTPEKMEVLKANGTNRVSIGIQSFIEKELKILNRNYPTEIALHALETIRSYNFDVLNVDLIYGIEPQTIDSFQKSIEYSLKFEPEEFYLYPLYIRPKTILYHTDRETIDNRMELYKKGRQILLDAGYHQNSMRSFSRTVPKSAEEHTSANSESVCYNCIEDGMIGLGCGSRSYTKNLHYSEPYAISQQATAQIVQDFINRDSEEYRFAYYGVEITPEDGKRRYLIKSMLKTKGTDIDAYEKWFKSEIFSDISELEPLIKAGYLEHSNHTLKPTELGLKYSDFIGPYLYSDRIINLMGDFKLR